jgi:hypothetical protein
MSKVQKDEENERKGWHHQHLENKARTSSGKEKFKSKTSKTIQSKHGVEAN